MAARLSSHAPSASVWPARRSRRTRPGAVRAVGHVSRCKQLRDLSAPRTRLLQPQLRHACTPADQDRRAAREPQPRTPSAPRAGQPGWAATAPGYARTRPLHDFWGARVVGGDVLGAAASLFGRKGPSGTVCGGSSASWGSGNSFRLLIISDHSRAPRLEDARSHARIVCAAHSDAPCLLRRRKARAHDTARGTCLCFSRCAPRSLHAGVASLLGYRPFADWPLSSRFRAGGECNAAPVQEGNPPGVAEGVQLRAQAAAASLSHQLRRRAPVPAPVQLDQDAGSEPIQQRQPAALVSCPPDGPGRGVHPRSCI